MRIFIFIYKSYKDFYTGAARRKVNRSFHWNINIKDPTNEWDFFVPNKLAND